MRPPTWSSLGLPALLLAMAPALSGQAAPGEDRLKRVETRVNGLNWELDSVRKAADDQLWFQRLSDVAVVDKVTYTGPPNPKGEETYGIKNERHPLKIQQYVFIPRKAEKGRKLPLIVLPHGGVHGDYGGLEIDDVVAGRDWAVEHLPVDPKRCAIVGWSHGGLIALMAVFDHPEKFAASYAGVPVSDLITRLGYVGQDYVAEFSAKFHIGKEPKDAVAEYRRRSPVWNVQKLRTPLLIHTNTNDRDVNVVEVEQLINALKAAGKTFESKIYQDAPGGHSFNRIDTTVAQDSRKEIYAFLEKHLK